MGMFGGNNETVTTTFKAVDQMSPVVKGMRATMADFKKSAMQGFGIGAGLSVFGLATKGLDLVTNAMGAASDQAEALSKVTVVFGEQADEIKKWASTAATSMGMTETAALSAAGTLGNLFDGMEIADQVSADMSRSIVNLAADLASFNNVAGGAEEVLIALQAGLVGETEPMRRFGVDINAAAVEAEVLASGMAKTKAEITSAMKVQARYNIIMSKTTNAQGDFARTAEGMANKSRTLEARMNKLNVAIGNVVNDAAGPLLDISLDVLDVFDRWSLSSNTLRDALAEVRDEGKGMVETFAPIGPDLFSIAIAGWGAELSEFETYYQDFIRNAAAGTMDWVHMVSGPLAVASRMSAQELAILADEYIRQGKTQEDFLRAVQRVAVGQREALGISSNATAAWAAAWGRSYLEVVETVTTGGAAIQEEVGGLSLSMFHAVTDMRETIKSGKAGIIEQFRDLAWQSKHPFAEVRYERWLEKKHREAMRKAKRAADAGKDGVAAQYRTLALQIMAEIQGLPGYAGVITEQTLDALAPIATVSGGGGRNRGGGRGGRTNRGGGGGGGGGLNTGGRGGRGRNSGRIGGRAAGGPVAAGETYLVGEQGPELLHMGNQSGRITPNHQMGGGHGHAIYLNGKLVGQAVDEYMGRAVAMGG